MPRKQKTKDFFINSDSSCYTEPFISLLCGVAIIVFYWVKQYISPVEYEVRAMNAPRCSGWLSQTQTLPNYLDQQTVKRYHEVRRSVEQRLHSCRVQGVVSMFNELSNEEKEECLKILQKTT